MAIWGKLIGTAAGLALGGPLGALLGGIAGHIYDQWRGEGTPLLTGDGWSSPGDVEPPPVFDDILETRRIAFATAIIVLAAKLAKTDGAVSRVEIRAFKELFDVRDEEVGGIARIFDEAKRSPLGFEPYARQVAQLFGYDKSVLAELLDGLFALAMADGDLHAAELAFLASVAGIFGFGPGEFAAIHARHQPGRSQRAAAPRPDDAYAVLGLTRSASAEEIKGTYRKLVREHHPDRLTAKGMPEEFVRQANQTLAAINAAYDRIAKERGLR
ncbi:MAG TPA: TerB family tellurite resistance protein [Geminicoccaceae bacterium]|nr:TerB family tellurite resistance protein [Geminicoccaceae bacterium]